MIEIQSAFFSSNQGQIMIVQFTDAGRNSEF